MALDLTLTFCTAITDVEQWAAYDFTTTSTPTETQVEGYAYAAGAIVQQQTERAGSLKTPPVSGVTPQRLARALQDANAIGAAYMARQHIYTYNGDERSKHVMERLAGLWQAYMGSGSIAAEAGYPALQFGRGGIIWNTIAAQSGTDLLRTPVSDGEIDLEDLSSDTQDATYTRTDRD